jgi:hypothetical protein
MGKATILIGISIFISMISLLVTLGVQSVDPNNPILTSNALKDTSSMLYSDINTGSDTWTFNKTYSSDSYLPGREVAGDLDTSQTIFPDWVYSGTKWITGVGSALLNCIGAPYTMAMLMAPNSSASAVIGAGLSLFNLFIIVGWMLGKID